MKLYIVTHEYKRHRSICAILRPDSLSYSYSYFLTPNTNNPCMYRSEDNMASYLGEIHVSTMLVDADSLNMGHPENAMTKARVTYSDSTPSSPRGGQEIPTSLSNSNANVAKLVYTLRPTTATSIWWPCRSLEGMGTKV